MIGTISKELSTKKAVLTIGDSKFVVTHNKRKIAITENDKTIYNLETSWWRGNATILETDCKITGVWGLKWGTQLKDKDGNTLLKIRNTSKIRNKNEYEIKIINTKVTNLEILIALYFHIYGSSEKMIPVMIGGAV